MNRYWIDHSERLGWGVRDRRDYDAWAVDRLPSEQAAADWLAGHEARVAAFGGELVVKLPAKFYLDHVARSLPAGRLLHEGARHVRVALDHDAFADLLSDAHYYADPATAAMMGDTGLAASARATVRRLLAAAPAGGS